MRTVNFYNVWQMNMYMYVFYKSMDCKQIALCIVNFYNIWQMYVFPKVLIVNNVNCVL